MMAGRFIIALIPYAMVAAFAFVQSRMPSMNDVALRSPRFPDESTGEVWEIAFRGGGVRYVTQADYIAYWAPFVAGPLFIIAVLWILHDWYKAGVFEFFSSK
jgi:hypothetical protein